MVGIGVGLLGVILVLLLFPTLELFYLILFAFVTGYLFMWAGIGFVGYSFLKSIGREHEFLASLGLSLLGLFIGMALYATVAKLILQAGTFVFTGLIFASVLPLIGAILGFNYKLVSS